MQKTRLADADILYERGDYFVLKARKGYEVYRAGIVAATRCAVIGSDGPGWFARAIAEADRRAGDDDTLKSPA